MYKIKRHILLNLFYIHGQYSGPITDEYEAIEEIENWSEALKRVIELQASTVSNTDGIFEDYYKYHHMKGIWGNPGGHSTFYWTTLLYLLQRRS